MEAAQKPGDALWDASWAESAGEKTIQERSKSRSNTVLYCSWFCPFAQRAWIALEEKEVDYKYVEINPYKVDPAEPGGYTKKSLSLEEKRKLMPDFVATSPRGLVPAIDFNGSPVWESAPAMEFVDEQFEGPPLMPTDPVSRAHVRIWTAHATERIQKAFYTMLMSQDAAEQEITKQNFFEECRIFARAMSSVGPFFLGEQFSVVDIALAPFWQRFVWIGSHYRNLQFPEDDAELQSLVRWWDVVQRRQSVARTIVCRDRLISSYSHYSRNVATSDVAMSLQSSLSTAKKVK